MFAAVGDAVSGALEQGDVCIAIPVPLIFDETLVQVKGEGSLVSMENALKAEPMTFAVTPLRGPVIVLSQSCDAAAAETEDNGRILIAPLTAEDDSSHLIDYRESFVKASSPDVLMKTLLSKPGQPAPKDVQKVTENAGKRRLDTLKTIWRGDVEGVFPIAEVKSGPAVIVPRSICHFDLSVTVPRSWIALLKKQRVARLTDTWRSVLQETLRAWIGRFAYPGTLDERYRVGLASELQAGDAEGEPGKPK